ncbi:MAG: hypothetical protein ABWW69_00845 [Pyrodictiaceae archaeon]
MGASGPIVLGLGFAILVLSVTGLVIAWSMFFSTYIEALKDAASTIEYLASSSLVIGNVSVNGTVLGFVVVNKGSTSVLFDDKADLIVLYYSGGVLRGAILEYSVGWNITSVYTDDTAKSIQPGEAVELLPGQRAIGVALLPESPDVNTTITLVLVSGKGVRAKYVSTA